MKTGAFALLLVLHAAVVLGGVYLMLNSFGDQLDQELDNEVTRVERRIDRDFQQVVEEVRNELDARFPSGGGGLVP